jgi:hypothetical protein
MRRKSGKERWKRERQRKEVRERNKRETKKE